MPEKKTSSTGTGFIFLGVVGWLVYVALINLNGVTKCVQYKRVKSIGGCNGAGSCGVMFTDYSKGTAKMPIIGEVVCTENHWWELKD